MVNEIDVEDKIDDDSVEIVRILVEDFREFVPIEKLITNIHHLRNSQLPLLVLVDD
jgi:hypothetical protein